MTTIAYCDGIIAYDSLCVQSEVIVDDNFEKRISANGAEFFLAGSTGDRENTVRAFFGGSEEGATCSGLVVQNGILYEVGYAAPDAPGDSRHFWREECKLTIPYAFGSGAYFALTAMDLGCCAVDAVRAAIKRDVNSGGKIRVYKL